MDSQQHVLHREIYIPRKNTAILTKHIAYPVETCQHYRACQTTHLCVLSGPVCWLWCSWLDFDCAGWSKQKAHLVLNGSNNRSRVLYLFMAIKRSNLMKDESVSMQTSITNCGVHAFLTSMTTEKTPHLNRRVGLGIGLGVRPLLLTRICSDGEKHCCLTVRETKDKNNKEIKFMLH